MHDVQTVVPPLTQEPGPVQLTILPLESRVVRHSEPRSLGSGGVRGTAEPPPQFGTVVHPLPPLVDTQIPPKHRLKLPFVFSPMGSQ